jgi:hypothetical protein
MARRSSSRPETGSRAMVEATPAFGVGEGVATGALDR